MVIEIVEHEREGWTEARCPACGQHAVMLAPRESTEAMRASLWDLIGHARRCQGASYRKPGAAGTTLYERLMNERYPRTRGGDYS